MDRDKLSRITAGILKMLVKATQQDRIDFDEDMAHEQIFYLLAPILADAEKWRKVKDMHEFKFVRHIESHLSGNQVPICTICGKTIFEIALDGKEEG